MFHALRRRPLSRVLGTVGLVVLTVDLKMWTTAYTRERARQGDGLLKKETAKGGRARAHSPSLS